MPPIRVQVAGVRRDVLSAISILVHTSIHTPTMESLSKSSSSGRYLQVDKVKLGNLRHGDIRSVPPSAEHWY